ncbi:MAG TPA: hypothetical protein VFB90_03080, partial [Dehalococcoidia bacterium]|nr:hypothetical protein [Dehalococcoidia bacterium]
MDDYGLDLEEVFKVIDNAEVLIVRFAIIDKRLLVDARTNETEGPLIQIVPRANSIEERFKSLKQLRPRFSLPDKIMSFMWHRPSMETFRSSGIWQRITDRLVLLGGDPVASECERVFNELVREE